jgi:hypothetical protein
MPDSQIKQLSEADLKTLLPIIDRGINATLLEAETHKCLREEARYLLLKRQACDAKRLLDVLQGFTRVN